MEPKRRSEFVTLETLDMRVSILEEGMHAMRKDMGDAVREIQSNTALTEQIQGTVEELKEGHAEIKGDVAAVKDDVGAVKVDTADIVQIANDVKRIFRNSARAGKWLTATCGGGAALVTFAKVIGWW